jgi:hypothetical protein
VTIVVEWENAIDVDDEWTARAISALEQDLAGAAPRMPGRPTVSYLYDQTAVGPAVIEAMIAAAGPRLRELANVELVPTPGLSYYKLKNFGIARATTEFSIMLDSDAAPLPGWIEHLLKPFADPKVMVVAGHTTLAHTNLLSRTMALSWFFDLADEREQTERRVQAHANNCAVRTEFFRANPFPDLPLFKKQCGFWLRDLTARGHGFVRTAGARAVHAPHPGLGYLMHRGWQSGSDRDYQIFQEKSRSRVARLGHSLAFVAKKTRRSWSRILFKGGKVGLPVWQRPAAMGIAFGYYLSASAGEAVGALTRSYPPLPRPEGTGEALAKRIPAA